MRSHRGQVFAGQAPSKANPDRVVFQFGKEGAKARFCGLMSHSGCTDEGLDPPSNLHIFPFESIFLALDLRKEAMSNFKSWLKTYWDEFAPSEELRLSTAEIRSLTDFLEDRNTVTTAARGDADLLVVA